MDNPKKRFRVFTNIHAGHNFETQVKVFAEGESDANDAAGPAFISCLHQAMARDIIGVDSNEEENSQSDSNIGNHLPLIIISLWARSQYPGWAIDVRRAKIEIKWQLSGKWEEYIKNRNTIVTA